MEQPMTLQEHRWLGIAEILKTSFNFSGRNDKSTVINMFLVYIPFCLLMLGADLTFVHVVASIVTSMESLAGVDPSSLESEEMVDGVLKNVWLLLGLELFFLAFFSIASLFCIIAIVFVSPSSTIHSPKVVFTKTGRPWMRQVIKWFYATSVMLVAIALVIISIHVLSVRVTGVPLIVSCILMIILGTSSYVYLAAVWMLSLVKSIADMDFDQVRVADESSQLNEGRRLQGFVLVLFSSVIGIGIYAAFAFGTRKIDQGIDSRSANGIVMLCYLGLMKLFMFLLYIVFYNELMRRSRGGGHMVEQRQGYVEILE